MAASLEYDALRKGFTLLKTGVSPGDIVSPLYDGKLLTPDERSKANASHLTPPQRMEEVCSALERRIKVEPTSFHKLITILKSVSGLEPLAEKLDGIYVDLSGGFPTQAEGGIGQLVLQPSQLPRNVVTPNTSRLSYPHSSRPKEKSPLSYFKDTAGDMSHETEPLIASSTLPVQDSQRDKIKSEMHLSRNPMSVSLTFAECSESIQYDALKSGMTPISSRKLKDLMHDFTDQSEQFEILKADRDRLQRKSCSLKKQLHEEREEYDGVLKHLEKTKIENGKLRAKNTELTNTHRATSEQNKIMKEELERMKSEREEILQREEEAVAKCELLEKQFREFSSKHYDTMLQLDYEFQAVLDDKRVAEGFKKKIKELKNEVERRKNATWP